MYDNAYVASMIFLVHYVTAKILSFPRPLRWALKPKRSPVQIILRLFSGGVGGGEGKRLGRGVDHPPKLQIRSRITTAVIHPTPHPHVFMACHVEKFTD
jgi:hypothetical protein